MATKSRKTASKKKKLDTNAEELLGYYREMLLIRRFEEKAGQLYGMGQIAGFCHLYIGQEAVVVGCRAAHGQKILRRSWYCGGSRKYRSRDEVTKTRSERDPIDAVRAQLLDNGWADEAKLKEMDKEIKAIVADAAEFAQTSPEPDPSELWTDVLLEA